MKQNKLLKGIGIFVFLYLITFVSGVNAQTWTAPAPVGEASITSGTGYYIYNVGSNAFLDRGGDWASQAIVFPSQGAFITPVLNGALYTLQFESASKTLFCVDLGGGMYTDNTSNTGNANNQFSIVLTDATSNIFSIQSRSDYGGYNAAQYVGTSATSYASNSGVVYNVMFNKPASDYTKWKFCTASAVALYNAKLKLHKYMSIAKALGSIDLSSYITTYNTGTAGDILTAASNLNTALAPVDKTSMIINAAFDANPTTGWTATSGYGYANTEVEYYAKSFDMNQTVTGLPAGIYILKAQGYERSSGISTTTQTWYANGWDSRGTSLYATASGTTSSVPLRTLFSESTNTAGSTINGAKYPNSMADGFTAFTTNGLYDNELTYFVVDATGTAKIGISSTTRANGSYVQGQWILYDNFRLYYYGAIPDISLSQSSLFYKDNTVKSFDITGLNLTTDITITSPAGITLSGTNLVSNGGGSYTISSANANSANTITATWDGVANFTGVNISVSNSRVVTKTIAISTTKDAACFTPLYSGLTNLVTEPYMNSLAAYSSSWGNAALSTNSYCGLFAGYISGTRAGSITYPLASVWKVNTKYRLKAKVKVVSGTFNLNVAGWSGSNVDLESTITPTSIAYGSGTPATVVDGTWNDVDYTFTTGSTLGSNQLFYFNNHTSNTAGDGYIDNVEMYAVPKVYTSAPSLTFLGVSSKKVAVRAENLSNNISISAPAGFTLSTSSLPSTVTGGVNDSITISFNGPTTASGYIYFTSGAVKDSMMVTGTMSPSLQTSVNYVSMDELNTTASFTVTGGNLVDGITMSAPAGITLNPSSLPMSANGATVNVTYNAAANSTGYITLTSTTASIKVRVLATRNADSFNPLYLTATNLIDDPYLNNAAAFGGWGSKAVNSDTLYVYGGAKSGKLSGAQCNGSIDKALTGTMKANTKYRTKAMIFAKSGNFQVGFFGWSGSKGDTTKLVNQGTGWQTLDFEITTGATLGGNQGIFFNSCWTGGTEGYIDNWELYEVPLSTGLQGSSLTHQNVYTINKHIVVDFNLNKSSNVSFEVYNLQGLLLSEQHEMFNPGNNNLVLKANLSSGIYIVRTKIDGTFYVKKVIL